MATLTASLTTRKRSQRDFPVCRLLSARLAPGEWKEVVGEAIHVSSGATDVFFLRLPLLTREYPSGSKASCRILLFQSCCLRFRRSSSKNRRSPRTVRMAACRLLAARRTSLMPSCRCRFGIGWRRSQPAVLPAVRRLRRRRNRFRWRYATARGTGDRVRSKTRITGSLCHVAGQMTAASLSKRAQDFTRLKTARTAGWSQFRVQSVL